MTKLLQGGHTRRHALPQVAQSATGETHSQSGQLGIVRTSGLSTLVSIQYLRAVAAVIVVLFHIPSNRVAEHWRSLTDFGLFGVDVFFVISGFIMWTSTRHRRASVSKFMRRRLLRIFPMWWIALSLWIGLRFIVPDRLHNIDVTTASVLCSFFLIPHYSDGFPGQIWPILVPGWTLQIEILFYLLFASMLLIERPRLRLSAVITALLAIGTVGAVWHPHAAVLAVLTSPLLIEFGFGILLGASLHRLRRLPAWSGLAMIAAAILLVRQFDTGIGPTGLHRVCSQGVSAWLLVMGGLILEGTLACRPNRALLAIGDASYSLYLLHPLAISAAALGWEHLGLPLGDSPATLPFFGVGTGAAVLVALVSYRWLEQPLLSRLSSGRSGKQIPSLPVEDFAEAA